MDERNFQRQLRRAYELARIKQGLVDALPSVLLAIAMVALVPGLLNVLLGSALVTASVFFRWVGQRYARGVGPGLALAWIPLLMPTVASRIGHICTPAQCVTWCGAACALGGLISGLALARLNGRTQHHPATWGVSSAIMVTASIAGCHCIGVTSLAAFVASLGLSALSGIWLWPAAAVQRAR